MNPKTFKAPRLYHLQDWNDSSHPTIRDSPATHFVTVLCSHSPRLSVNPHVHIQTLNDTLNKEPRARLSGYHRKYSRRFKNGYECAAQSLSSHLTAFPSTLTWHERPLAMQVRFCLRTYARLTHPLKYQSLTNFIAVLDPSNTNELQILMIRPIRSRTNVMK